MKKKIVISTILLLLLISSISYAWFTTSADIRNSFKAGTVEVKVLEPDWEDIEGAVVKKYDKNVQVQSLGSKKTYVRVRLVPEWSNPSLPVSNVSLNLVNNGDWIPHTDGYYYFKYYLTTNQITSLLLEGITFTELGPDYEGEVFTLKVVAEGVQISNDGWKQVWNLDSLPFTPDQPWND